MNQSTEKGKKRINITDISHESQSIYAWKCREKESREKEREREREIVENKQIIIKKKNNNQSKNEQNIRRNREKSTFGIIRIRNMGYL